LTVELVPSRPGWTDEFERIASELRASLGDAAVAIDHIGSTSVPGLAAKDVIDVQVAVRELGVQVAGFEAPFGDGIQHDHVPEGWTGDLREWEKQFFRRREPRAVNVHVRRAGSANTRYALLFRDYLRANPEARDRWEAVTREAAERYPDRRVYTEEKDALTDVLIAAAEKWARATGWVVSH
jgi:GrpB-like predicted nucleotidyltransferase (UPF0157 family)